MLDMKIYSYMIDHDYGLAPNPFGKYCTVAVCKPQIRKSRNLHIGDWIIGTGSKSLAKSSGFNCVKRLIFAMKVSEIIGLNEYWHDPRFQYKKPVMNGTLTTMFGDNFYFKDEDGNWKQQDCAHRNIDGIYNDEHMRKDTEGKNALISDLFYYFGNNAPLIPQNLADVCHTTRGVKKIISNDLISTFLKWLKHKYKPGLQGYPINWTMYDK